MKNRILPVLVAGSIAMLVPMHAFAGQMKLEQGQKVILALEESVSAKDASENSPVTLRVVDDVRAADMKTVLIKAGAKATAEVDSVSKPGGAGKPGELKLRAVDTNTVDGSKVRLRGTVDKEGSSRLVLSVVLAAVLFPIGLLFLLMKGGDAKAPAGLRLNAYTDQDVLVTVQ